MKKVLFLLVLFPTGLWCQLQLPFADSNAAWTQSKTWYPDPASPGSTYSQTVYRLYPNGDTTIYGIEYKKLNLDFNPYDLFITPGELAGYYRYDSSKVYFKNEYLNMNVAEFVLWSGDTSEFLMYDYDLQIGDTFDIDVTPWSEWNMILMEIDSILIGGSYYRKFIFDQWVTDASYYGPYYWIEGIGSCHGFFPNNDWCECINAFHCFHEWNQTGTYAYYPLTQGSCYFSVGVEELNKPTFSVFPNPGADEIRINSSLINEIGILVDSRGNKIAEFELQNGTCILDISKFESGVYFIKCSNQVYKVLII